MTDYNFKTPRLRMFAGPNGSGKSTLKLKTAKQLGYRTYLYYIATNDPEINIARVQQRVQKGGHDVPKDKIVSRYTRSLKNLSKAIEHSDRAYLFDNSGDAAVWVCEITNGKAIEYKQEVIPYWLDQYVVEALG